MIVVKIASLICIIFVSTTFADVQCPDKHSVCPDETTCCELKSGQWGCCPMPRAVCCTDKLHCCPEGTTCDLQQQTCVSSSGINLPMSRKFLARREQVNNIECDSHGSMSCPDGTTCCKMPSGDWGCCPLPKAVCCNDHVHCCPADTICNLQEQKCSPKNFLSASGTPWSVKFRAVDLRANAKDVSCDPQFSCPDNTTCCKMDSGDWGCCPMPDAVCCEDKIHCCPQGTTCDVTAGTCNQLSNFLVGKVKNMALTYGKKHNLLNDIHCPDPSKTCNDGETCCKWGTPVTWGCCPLPHAVCCTDKVHCCPQGTKCGNASSCTSQHSNRHALDVFPMQNFVIKASNPLFRAPNDLICPDKRSVCPGNDVTCCLTTSGGYGCCDMPNAVCCSNKKYCCPQNTTCSLLKDKCFLEEIPLISNDIAEARFYSCPDGLKKCFNGTTCCKTANGFGCCPHSDGICCQTGGNCCPKGTLCSRNGLQCNLDAGFAIDSSPLLTDVENSGVTYCAGSDLLCKSGGKCCKNYLGEYSCCPDSDGDCCIYGNVCCPKGYMCNNKGTCTIALNEKKTK